MSLASLSSLVRVSPEPTQVKRLFIGLAHGGIFFSIYIFSRWSISSISFLIRLKCIVKFQNFLLFLGSTGEWTPALVTSKRWWPPLCLICSQKGLLDGIFFVHCLFLISVEKYVCNVLWNFKTFYCFLSWQGNELQLS